VKDFSGAVIPNAQVLITEVATGVTRTVSLFRGTLHSTQSLPGLMMSVCRRRVLAPTAERRHADGRGSAVLDFTMKVGQMTQTVEVTRKAHSRADLVRAGRHRKLDDGARIAVERPSWTELAISSLEWCGRDPCCP